MQTRQLHRIFTRSKGRKVAVVIAAVATVGAGLGVIGPAAAVDERIILQYLDSQYINTGPGAFNTQRYYRVTNSLGEPVAVSLFGTNAGQQGGGQPPFCSYSSDAAGNLTISFAGGIEVICNFNQAYRGPSPFGGTPTESWAIDFQVRPAQSLVRLTNRQAGGPAWGPWFGSPTVVTGTTDTFTAAGPEAAVAFGTSVAATSAALGFVDAAGNEISSSVIPCVGSSCVGLHATAPAGAVQARVRAAFPSQVQFLSGYLDNRPARLTTITSGPRTVPNTTTTTTPPTTSTTTVPGTTTTTTTPPTTTKPAGTFTVSVAPSPVAVGGNVTFSAAGLTPASGRVDFTLGGIAIGTALVNPDGTARVTNSVWTRDGVLPVVGTHVYYVAGVPASKTATTTLTVGGAVATTTTLPGVTTTTTTTVPGNTTTTTRPPTTTTTTTTVPGGVLRRWTFVPGNTDGWSSWFAGTVTAGTGVLNGNAVSGSYATAQTIVTGVTPGTKVWLEGTLATTGAYNITLQYYDLNDTLLSIQRIPINDPTFQVTVPASTTQVLIGIASTTSFTLRGLALRAG
jgi:hypothetical protein